eukprot:scaffold69289_cov112-Cyclotella_meneghiniana.AAC.4
MKRQARAKRESTKGGRVDSNRHKNFSNQSTKDGREDSICWNNFDDVSATDELSMKSSNITVSAHTRDGNRGVEKVNLASSESIATSASGTAKTKRRISLEKQASLVSDKKVSFTDKPDYILDSKDDEWRQNFAKASDRSFSEDLSKLSVSTIRLNYDNDDGSTKQCCGISTASAAVSKDGSLLQSNASAASIDSLNSLFGICNEETAVSKHIKDLPSSKADSDTEPTVNTSIASLGNDDRTLDSFLTQTRKQGAEGYKEIKVVSIHNQSEHLTSPSRTRHPLPQRKYSRSKSTKSGANSHTPHSYSKVTVQRRSSIPADALRSTLSSRKNDRNAECPSPNQVPGHPPPPPKRRTNKGLVRYKSNGCIPPPPPPPRNQSFTRRSTS